MIFFGFLSLVGSKGSFFPSGPNPGKPKPYAHFPVTTGSHLFLYSQILQVQFPGGGGGCRWFISGLPRPRVAQQRRAWSSVCLCPLSRSSVGSCGCKPSGKPPSSISKPTSGPTALSVTSQNSDYIAYIIIE